jgi:hypothetical protein
MEAINPSADPLAVLQGRCLNRVSMGAQNVEMWVSSIHDDSFLQSAASHDLSNNAYP